MKIFKLLTMLLLLFLATSLDSFSQPLYQSRHHHRSDRPRPTIGAPLDGGILAVLGAAGVAYFIGRKRKKNL